MNRFPISFGWLIGFFLIEVIIDNFTKLKTTFGLAVALCILLIEYWSEE